MEYYMTSWEYWSEITEIANECKQRERDGEELSDIVHEWIDSHQWVIYTPYHYEVLRISSNVDYGCEEGLIDLNEDFKEGGLGRVTMSLTYRAMYADVMGTCSEISDKGLEDESQETAV
jgi:hypothetical protein